MKLMLPILLIAAGATAWIAVRAEPPHRTRPDHRPAPETLAAPAGPGERVVSLAVEGMCCSGCTEKLHQAALGVAGVREAAVDFESGTVLARAATDVDVAALEAALTFDKYRAKARP